MRKRLRTVAAYTLAGMVGFVLAYLFQWFKDGRATTVTRLSPDETIRARLVELAPRWDLDRRFAIRLESLIDGETRTVFYSPKQARSEGTERLIWSKDGTKLLLVGRHFVVKDDLFLDNGDQLFFLHDVPTGRSWCNADPPAGPPPLRSEMVEGFEFTEPVVMKKLP